MPNRQVPPALDGPAPLTVLVADDEEAIVELLDVALSKHGMKVLRAIGGVHAIEVYREQLHDISVVLLDVQMEGLDGPGTLAALQKINPYVRCCFMSGHTGKYTSDDLLGLGAGRVLDKPFRSLAELAKALCELAGTEAWPAKQ